MSKVLVALGGAFDGLTSMAPTVVANCEAQGHLLGGVPHFQYCIGTWTERGTTLISWVRMGKTGTTMVFRRDVLGITVALIQSHRNCHKINKPIERKD